MAGADDVDAAVKLNFCKQALGEIGTRSTITALDPPDGSQEAFYCNLFFDGTRDQLLRAAHWSFAGRTDKAVLWKALPGTPENPTVPAGYQWSNRDPAPPWLYSYVHKNAGILQVRRVREGAQPGPSFDGVPIFGGVVGGLDYNQAPCVPFEVANDPYDRNGTALAYVKNVSTITVTAAGTGYRAGDYITMVGDAASLMGQPVTVHVLSIDASGGVVQTGIADGGTFTGATVSVSQSATTGNGTGFACSATAVAAGFVEKVILTNARNMVMDYTTNVTYVQHYDPSFGDAFMLALEGKLALALTGDKAMAQAKFQQANAAIIDARVRDGNEGLTTYDHVPDWLAVRGVASMGSPSGWFNPPYGPLFAV